LKFGGCRAGASAASVLKAIRKYAISRPDQRADLLAQRAKPLAPGG
jgi:hypothetical protein